MIHSAAIPAKRRVDLVGRALRSPSKAWRVSLALIRGHLCRISCMLRGVRFEAGRNLRIEGKLHIRGPGRVIFGDDVTIGMVVTPWTYHQDAVLRVGSKVFLNGTRFGCASSITVGDRCILADAQIMDTDFHSTHIDRWSAAAPVHSAPVVLGNNVWVAGRVGLLAGTDIGENSVVGFASVCRGAYPANVLIAGNPARPVRPVPGSPESGASLVPEKQ